jgi:hypothetical protein
LNNAFRHLRSALVLAGLLLVAACAIHDKTTLDASWVSPDRQKSPYRKVLIITVSGNEFVQQEFQDLMAQKLQAHGMNAVASHLYFTRYVDAELKRFRDAVEASDADAVLLTRVTDTQTETRSVPDYSLYLYPTQVQASQDHSLTTLMTETALFDRKTEKPVWTARAKTSNAGTGDREAAIAQYVGLVINAMVKDKLI